MTINTTTPSEEMPAETSAGGANPARRPALALLRGTHTLSLGPASEKLTSTTSGQVESSVTAWTAVDGAVEAGVWEATPGTFTAVRDSYHEVCQVLSGRATVVSDSGESIEVGSGDLFVMPIGWRSVWQVHETIRKTYVTIGMEIR
jgi:uncharacterized cupin superfamily protein